MKDIAAIIPVFNPERGLIPLCAELRTRYDTVLVVDDGSNEHVEDFAKLPDAVVLVRHDVNKGKGRAIKTGIKWVVGNRPEVKVVVFADGDGQHRPEDVDKVAEHAIESDHVTLGVRDFMKTGIPFRSRFGNILTSFLVRCIFRLPIYDTQTGLRAIPRRLFDVMLTIPGERYEYEMRLFGMIKAHSEALDQVPIQTIYVENNRASHFDPIKDSFRVYQGLLGGSFIKFCLSSLFGFGVDNIAFTLLLLGVHPFGMMRRHEILMSLVGARLISATANYFCNRCLVFDEASTKCSISFARYWALVVAIAALSYIGTASLSFFFDAQGVCVTGLKVVVETGLFVLSYYVQKKWVFAS